MGNEEFKFQVGDKVRDCRYNEILTLESNPEGIGDDVYIFRTVRKCGDDGDDTNTYTETGKDLLRHDNPMITLVERPNKKESVTWHRVYYHHKSLSEFKPVRCSGLYKSLEDFLKSQRSDEDDFHWIKLEPIHTHKYGVGNDDV